MTIDEALDIYEKGRLNETISGSRTIGCLRTLKEAFRNQELQSLTTGKLLEYRSARADLGYSSGTIDKELGVLSAAIGFCRSAGLHDHCVKFQKSRPQRRNTVLSVNEVKQLVAACSDLRAKVYLQLLFLTGQRKEALQTLRRNQITAGVIEFEVSDSVLAHRRKRRARTPITPRIQGLFRLMERKYGKSDFIFCGDDGTGNCKFKLDRWLEQASRETGIKATAHVFRHSAATIALEAGRTMYEVSNLLGHSNTAITELTYSHRQPKHSLATVNTLEALLG